MWGTASARLGAVKYSDPIMYLKAISAFMVAIAAVIVAIVYSDWVPILFALGGTIIGFVALRDSR